MTEAPWMGDHLDELCASRGEDAGRARDLVVTALEAIEAAERAYAEVEQWYIELLRPVPGVDGRNVPSLNLSAVKSEAEGVLDRGVPTPLPLSIFETKPADPTIRSVA